MTHEADQYALSDEDLVFECPHCGKSLAINRQGAGMVISCPDCKAKVQVPVVEDLVVQQQGGPALEQLERLRIDNLDHFDEIGKELGLIQAAVDRIVGILQDAAAENDRR